HKAFLIIEKKRSLDRDKAIYLHKTALESQDQQWLTRLSRENDLFEKMKSHPYINPCDRAIARDIIFNSSPQFVTPEQITFEPETTLMTEHEYTFCSQLIRISFTASNDVPIFVWIAALEEQMPGLLKIEKLSISRPLLTTKNLKGELVCQWSFLRISL
ncbi:MAG: hypothetical protein J0G29_00850, partial [Alphaproteobacteria bacterium]|nr:hypothetical protein [Alphaproteobacteria bacterium]